LALPPIEEQTLGAARAGAEWAWNAIYRTLAPFVAGYLRAQGASDPEDLTGEVFLQVVRAIHRFEGDGRAFRSWVFSIAHNKLIDDRQRRSRRPVPQPISNEVNGYAARDNVEDEALMRLAAGRVERIISGLTEDQRAVLVLRLMGGLTVTEVAEAVRKSVTAVKALQRRGLATVRRELAAQGVSV
jgi:RNA polymerase sigma factor (sigma-70 family)